MRLKLRETKSDYKNPLIIFSFLPDFVTLLSVSSTRRLKPAVHSSTKLADVSNAKEHTHKPYIYV